MRKATGRDDIWGVGLPMSAAAADTDDQFQQFMHAYEADYVTRDGRLVIDEPAGPGRLVKALDGYTAIYRKGCTPPDAVDWDDIGNNKAFLAQTVVMTPNTTLSIPNALRADAAGGLLQERGHDRVAGRRRRPAARHRDRVQRRPWSSRPAGTSRLPKEFVRFLVGEGWLAHWLDFAGDRFLPPMPALLRAAVLARPGRPAPDGRGHAVPDPAARLRLRGGLRRVAARAGYRRSTSGPKAVHRVVAEGLSPEQAVDEAIARIKQILSE